MSVEMCPLCGRVLSYEVDGKTYSKATLVEIRGVYDGGLFYADMDGCGFAWHRWPEDHYLRERAETYLESWNLRAQEKQAKEKS
jgi:hypothetical protein